MERRFGGYFAEKPHRAVDELTNAETAVLRYLSHGMTVGDVARVRFVTDETVRTQMRSVRFKLAAKTAAHAVAIALRHGVIE